MNVQRTTMQLDSELLAQAQAILGTTTTSDTVHEALRSLIGRDHAQQLAGMDLRDMTLADIKHMRKPLPG